MVPEVVDVSINQAIVLAWDVSAYYIIPILVIGLVVSLLQAVTSIQEQALSFVPKLIAFFGISLFMGSALLEKVSAFVRAMFMLIPDLVG